MKHRPFVTLAMNNPTQGKSPLAGLEYQVLFALYSVDGKRAAEVRAFCNGETYISEEEWVEGTTFKNRHAGRMVGPFASPEEAEKFIVKTAWFCGRDK
jgi:hypothetical protein